jgi:A1 cistron-splicing factor AAR2
LLRYDHTTESISLAVDEVISDDRLKSLDHELAAYPFEGLVNWRRLTTYVDERILEVVLGMDRRIDGLMNVRGEAHDVDDGMKALFNASKGGSTGRDEVERQLGFVEFDLRRSWRDGAVGEEVTKFAKDKSYLLEKVTASCGE